MWILGDFWWFWWSFQWFPVLVWVKVPCIFQVLLWFLWSLSIYHEYLLNVNLIHVYTFIYTLYCILYNILLLIPIPYVPAMCLKNQWFQYIYDGTTTVGTWKNLRFLCETKESRSSSVVKKMTSPESSPFGAAQGRWFLCFTKIILHVLGGGFKYFLFSPRKLGKMNPFWRSYFSNGLVQPATRYIG